MKEKESLNKKNKNTGFSKQLFLFRGMPLPIDPAQIKGRLFLFDF